MMTVSICALVSVLSAASPNVSYRSHPGSQPSGVRTASQGSAHVGRITRQESLNGRGQVWRSSDVRVGSPTTAARSPTTIHSFLIDGK
jgi:hypothetical protein